MLGLTHNTGTAIIEGITGEEISYDRLRRLGRHAVAALGKDPELLAIFADSDLRTVAAYVGALLGRHPVLLLDASMRADAKARILAAYQPRWAVGPAGLAAALSAEGRSVTEATDLHDGELLRLQGSEPPEFHPDLALLLATSGTTGSVKFVRLSRQNVDSNASAIVHGLGLDDRERAITSLPLHYTFGLSVLNSHLAVGAATVLSAAGLLQTDFWRACDRHACTSLAGVPTSYRLLERIGFRDRPIGTLRTMTQAGGALEWELVETYAAHMQRHDGRLFVMYGQTEATARISILPPDQLARHPGSAGVAIEGGELSIDDGSGEKALPGTPGEVLFRGPGVMLGYAEGAGDLVRGDDLSGLLRTGDLGYLDDEGFLYLTGRTKRIAKPFGRRVDLDDVERTLRPHGAVAVVGDDDQIRALCAFGDETTLDSLRRELVTRYGLHESALMLRRVEDIPTTTSGKVDYAQVQMWLST